MTWHMCPQLACWVRKQFSEMFSLSLSGGVRKALRLACQTLTCSAILQTWIWIHKPSLLIPSFEFVFSGCGKTPWRKAPWGGRVYFSLQLIIHQEGRQGKEPEGRNRCRKHGLMLTGLLVCSSRLVHPVCLQNPGPSSQGWHHPQWGGPSSNTPWWRKHPHGPANKPIW